MFNRRTKGIANIGVGLAIFLSLACHSPHREPAAAGKCDVINDYDIAAGRFDETAQQLAHATGCFIETDLGNTGGIGVRPVQGRMTIRQALERSIQGTSLTIIGNEPNKISVK